jgi:multidrug efflux system outer membrane protein
LSESAFQTYLSTVEAERNVRITLISDIAQAYFYVRMTELTLALIDQTLKSRQNTYAIVQKRFQGGIATEIEVTQARSLLDAAAANLAFYVRQKNLAQNALVLLVGQPIPDNLPPAATFNRESVVGSIPAGLPSDLLSRRPDIRQAERNLLAANANIGAARSAFFPNISLTGLLGTNSTSLGGLFKSGAYYWSLAPNLSLPIFSGGTLLANLDLAKASNKEFLNQYEKSIQTAFKEVSDALAGEATYGAEIQATLTRQETTRKTLELSMMRYRTGIDNFLQPQIAQIDYFNAQLALIQLRYNALSNRINLYKALGGGWQY